MGGLFLAGATSPRAWHLKLSLLAYWLADGGFVQPRQLAEGFRCGAQGRKPRRWRLCARPACRVAASCSPCAQGPFSPPCPLRGAPSLDRRTSPLSLSGTALPCRSSAFGVPPQLTSTWVLRFLLDDAHLPEPSGSGGASGPNPSLAAAAALLPGERQRLCCRCVRLWRPFCTAVLKHAFQAGTFRAWLGPGARRCGLPGPGGNPRRAPCRVPLLPTPRRPGLSPALPASQGEGKEPASQGAGRPPARAEVDGSSLPFKALQVFLQRGDPATALALLRQRGGGAQAAEGKELAGGPDGALQEASVAVAVLLGNGRLVEAYMQVGTAGQAGRGGPQRGAAWRSVEQWLLH